MGTLLLETVVIDVDGLKEDASERAAITIVISPRG